MSENTTTGGLVEELRALRNVVADRHRSASEALAEVRGANKLRIYEYQRGREIAYDFIQGELDDLLDAHASRTTEADVRREAAFQAHRHEVLSREPEDVEDASFSPEPGAVEALARLLHNEGDGGVWESFDWPGAQEVARVVFAAGYLSPADVGRVVAAAKAEAWDEGKRVAEELDCEATVSWGRCGVAAWIDRPGLFNPYRTAGPERRTKAQKSPCPWHDDHGIRPPAERRTEGSE